MYKLLRFFIPIVIFIITIGCCPKNESEKIMPILEEVKNKVLEYKKKTGRYPNKEEQYNAILKNIGCKHIFAKKYKCKKLNYNFILEDEIGGNDIKIFYIGVSYNDTMCHYSIKQDDMSIFSHGCSVPPCGKM